MDIKGSKTEQNLLAAFAGESQARNKYYFFSSVAIKEGYQQIADLFLETAENEKEHAKILFKLLNGIGTTIDNLKAAAAGEHYEWTQMYKDFAATAKEEGFTQIAEVLLGIAKIEEYHEQRYNKLLSRVENETVFTRPEPVKWQCRNCGHVHEGPNAPDICPVCKHPKAFFEVQAENY